jgi:hypothetical protein
LRICNLSLVYIELMLVVVLTRFLLKLVVLDSIV